ncbi:ribbon-helix-helix protein, CopG family [Synechococcus sp. CBW1107]|uniref:ribbon-helix-helix protein, CopG family n=1 Tax=Synechococcus sp. CBW1107 TaxID=2789857 RepID=UPI003A0FCD7F
MSEQLARLDALAARRGRSGPEAVRAAVNPPAPSPGRFAQPGDSPRGSRQSAAIRSTRTPAAPVGWREAGSARLGQLVTHPGLEPE